jgi:hypothetical protein
MKVNYLCGLYKNLKKLNESGTDNQLRIGYLLEILCNNKQILKITKGLYKKKRLQVAEYDQNCHVI